MLEDSFSPFYVAGVRLSWNMGKLYTLKNDRRKIATNRQAVEVERETFLFNTRLQLTQQNTEIRKMTDLMKADDKIIRLRASIKKAAEVKLANGVISVTDLIREINSEDLARQTAALRQAAAEQQHHVRPGRAEGVLQRGGVQLGHIPPGQKLRQSVEVPGVLCKAGHWFSSSR